MPRPRKTSASKNYADKERAPDLTAMPVGSGDLLAALLAIHRSTPNARRHHADHPCTARTKNGSAVVKRLLLHELVSGEDIECDLCGRPLSWTAEMTDADDVRMPVRLESTPIETIADYLITCSAHQWLPRAAESLGCPLTVDRFPGRSASLHPDPLGKNPPGGRNYVPDPLGETPVGGETSRDSGVRSCETLHPNATLALLDAVRNADAVLDAIRGERGDLTAVARVGMMLAIAGVAP